VVGSRRLFALTVLLAGATGMATQVGYVREGPKDEDVPTAADVIETAAEGGEAGSIVKMEDLAISPSGALPTQRFEALASPGTPALQTMTMEDLAALVWLYETAGTFEEKLPVIGVGEDLVSGLGAACLNYLDMDACLKEVLEEMKRRRAVVMAMEAEVVVVEGVRPDGSVIPVSTSEGGLDGTGGMGSEPEGGFPMFGLVIVILFAGVMGVGMMARSG